MSGGLVDAREDNGENKITETYEAELLSILEGSPQDHGYLRPTWTQERLVLVLAERTQVCVSVTTTSRIEITMGVTLTRKQTPHKRSCLLIKQGHLAPQRRICLTSHDGAVQLFALCGIFSEPTRARTHLSVH